MRICVAFLLAISAPAAEYSHRVWRTEDGLPQNRVQAIAQTREGYLWAGTSEGLARFDGFRFVIYDQSNTPAIADNSISSLEAAADGSLWIGTEGGGLLHYGAGLFRRFGQKEGLTNGFIRATHVDREGKLWVGTDRGLFRSLGAMPLRFERLDNTPAVRLASVVSIVESADGVIHAASSSGLLEFSGGALRYRTCPGGRTASAALRIALLREGLISDVCAVPRSALPDVPINSLHRDAAGSLWMGTTGAGLMLHNETTGERKSFLAPSALPVTLFFWCSKTASTISGPPRRTGLCGSAKP